jgi:hypothetical protein
LSARNGSGLLIGATLAVDQAYGERARSLFLFVRQARSRVRASHELAKQRKEFDLGAANRHRYVLLDRLPALEAPKMKAIAMQGSAIMNAIA